MRTKPCTKCGQIKPLDEFYTRSDNGKPFSACKVCSGKGGKSVNLPTVNAVNLPVLEEILGELRALRFAIEALEQRLDALSSTDARPTADVNINIRTPAPEDDPRYQNVAAKLLGMNFEQAFNDVDKKRGH